MIFQHLFPQFRRKGFEKITQSLFTGFIDYHSHILPGVDDGVQTLEESLECLAIHERLGFKEVWLTPHVMEDIPNTTETLKSRFDDLKQAYSGEIRLHLAAEYMMDPLLSERIESDDLLPIGGKLLVETSYYDAPENFYDLLESILTKGYVPLLAHPERYNYMCESDYIRLKDMGVRLQLNLLSLVGLYGWQTQGKAERLCKGELYDVAGSDLHSLRQSGLLERMAYTSSHSRYINPISPTMNKS